MRGLLMSGSSGASPCFWPRAGRPSTRRRTKPAGNACGSVPEAPVAAANAMEFPRFDLEGQTALVTGAARGIGRAIALALAQAGADVALGLRQPGSAEDLVDEIQAMGRRATAVAMDVRRLEQ